jgi:hypothetical protein
MKRHVAALVIVFRIATLASAGEFHSAVITDTPLTINVPDERYLTIQNFTQQGGSTRGVVTVTTNGKTAKVLNATMISSGAVVSELIKSVRIAGPATVTVNPVTKATLFITYRKRIEPADLTATPVPTVTPTATPTPTPQAASVAIFETTTLNSDIAESPTPTPTPLDRPSPTPTPTPSITPSPSPTPTPSLTPG